MENYKKLLKLIHQFQYLKIWEYIDSRDIFEIQLTKQRVYVSILGNAKIEYGIIVYTDYFDLSSQMMCENDGMYGLQPDMPFHLSCLKIDCVDGKIMSQHDTSGMIYEYGIEDDCIAVKFSIGKPMRLVNEKECLLLIELLELLIDYADSIKSLDFEVLDDTETYLLKRDKESISKMIISFPGLTPPTYKISSKIDNDLFEKVSQFDRKDEWTIGIFYSPVFIEDEEPYFPKICIIYNISKDTILDILIPYKEDYQYFPQNLLESFSQIGYLPEYLYLSNYETLSYFANLLDLLKIDGEIDMVDQLNDIYDNLSEEIANDAQQDLIS